MSNVGVISLGSDIHAQSVCYLARKRGRSIVHIDSDKLHQHRINASVGAKGKRTSLLVDHLESTYDVGQFSKIWWRRPFFSQIAVENKDAVTRELVNNCGKILVNGVFKSIDAEFINPIGAAERAENKILQLQAASENDLKVPETLFSNDFKTVQTFHDRFEGRVVMKSLYNTSELQLKTRMLNAESLDEASIRLSPTIFQEYIEGVEHYRVFMIGLEYQAVRFINQEIDSRDNLSVPAEKIALDVDLVSKLQGYLRGTK